MTHFKHNFKIAWRNLLKHKTTTAINLLGLTVGIAAFISILTIVRYELSFNQRIPNKELIYRIYSSFSGVFEGTNPGVATPVGPYIEEHMPETATVAYFHTWNSKVSKMENNQLVKLNVDKRIVISTPSYFDVIDQYHWLAGNPQSLSQPNKMALTDEQAYKYFNTKNWSEILNRKLIYRDSLHLEVAGIVHVNPTNNDFDFTEFISFATLKNGWLGDQFSKEWDNTSSNSQLFLKLNTLSDTAQLNLTLSDINALVASKEEADSDWITTFNAQPLSNLHFNTEIGIMDSGNRPAHLKTLLILGVIAFVILLIAIFNFINLETAQSTLKSKEVGIRKVLGSARSLLIGRFLTESSLITIIAVLIAIPLSHLALNYFDEFLPRGLYIDYSNPFYWISLLIIALTVSLLAGFYPSWIVASFQPIEALKSDAAKGYLSVSWVRKSLILLQFLFAQLLIFGTLAISWQISYMLDKELGFQNEGILTFSTPYLSDPSKQEILLNEISEIPEISEFIVQGDAPVQNGYSTSTVEYITENGKESLNVHNKRIKEDYFDFYNLDLIAGQPLIPNDTIPEMIINETFMKALGYKDPNEAIGESFTYSNKNTYIRGIVKDFHFQSLHHNIEPMMMRYSSSNVRLISFKTSKENVSKVIDKITIAWNELYPEDPATIGFMEDMISRFYQTEKRASKLASAATFIAILISCLGLIGLISFSIVRKTKEIGIRKVLGANTIQLSSILSKEFLILIGMAFLISLPITFFFAQKFEENFAYTAGISWWLYALGGVVSVVIALISISLKIYKASKSNPVDSLRYE